MLIKVHVFASVMILPQFSLCFGWVTHTTYFMILWSIPYNSQQKFLELYTYTYVYNTYSIYMYKCIYIYSRVFDSV